jgi:hypothetical protein
VRDSQDTNARGFTWFCVITNGTLFLNPQLLVRWDACIWLYTQAAEHAVLAEQPPLHWLGSVLKCSVVASFIIARFKFIGQGFCLFRCWYFLAPTIIVSSRQVHDYAIVTGTVKKMPGGF